MTKENSVKQILRLTVTLLLICAVVAGVLAGVNAITKDKIAAAQEQKKLDALATVLPGVEGLEIMELTGDTGMVKAVYCSASSYAVEVTPNGFSGEITLMVGITEGKVQGISVISHAETPSLGAEAAADSSKGQSFRNQFAGLSGVLAVEKDGGEIDSLTSATITSRAITQGVNAALEFVESLG